MMVIFGHVKMVGPSGTNGHRVRKLVGKVNQLGEGHAEMTIVWIFLTPRKLARVSNEKLESAIPVPVIELRRSSRLAKIPQA